MPLLPFYNLDSPEPGPGQYGGPEKSTQDPDAVGMLGYGFSEPIFWQAIEDGVDAMILDSGSTDGGPARLAKGAKKFAPESYIHDLSILLAACHSHRVPLLIGSAGGDGEDDAVDMFVDIITKIVAERNIGR